MKTIRELINDMHEERIELIMKASISSDKSILDRVAQCDAFLAPFEHCLRPHIFYMNIEDITQN